VGPYQLCWLPGAVAVPSNSIRRGLPFLFTVAALHRSPKVLPVATIPSFFEQAPDEHEFTVMFRQHYPRLCLFAFRIVNHRETAEDIVQDCFAELWQKRNTVDIISNMCVYLYGMIRLKAYRYLRDKKTGIAEPDENLADDATALLHIIEAETLNEIYRAVDALPAKCAAIFKSLFVEGKKIREVSDEQEVSESTVRSHKAAALAILRARITTWGALCLCFLY